MRLGRHRDQLADVGPAVVAAEALQRARAGGGEREADRPALALVAAGGPELAVFAEADRVRPLAVEGGLEIFAEAGGGELQVEGREVLEREVPAAGRQPQRLRRL